VSTAFNYHIKFVKTGKNVWTFFFHLDFEPLFVGDEGGLEGRSDRPGLDSGMGRGQTDRWRLLIIARGEKTHCEVSTMKILYFDCFAGVAGDMILGALVDAGLGSRDLVAEIDKLGVDGIELSFEKVKGAGALSGTRAHVKVDEGESHRHLPQIVDIIRSSALDGRVQDMACRVFERLAEAEAAVHGIPVDKIHFHEAGALDAIVDVVGAAAGLWLLGIEGVYSSELCFGKGTVECRHGTLPVPVPAVARLAEGFRVRFSDLEGERTTPTGAAIVTALAHAVGETVRMVPEKVGYGFGSRQSEGIPNALRVIIASAPGTDAAPGGARADEVVLLETNVDDVTGQTAGFLMEECFAAGAVDVFFTPIQMKKNRPALQVSALCKENAFDAVYRALALETGTLGIRISRIGRMVAPRSEESAATSLGPVRIKRSSLPGGTERIAIEYDDLARLARERGLPLRTIRKMLEAELS